LARQRKQSLDFTGQSRVPHGLFEDDISACSAEVILQRGPCPRYHHNGWIRISQPGVGADCPDRLDAFSILVDDDNLHGCNPQKSLESGSTLEARHPVATRLRQETPEDGRKGRVRCQYGDCPIVHKQAEHR
jgi:hypothetical protein